LAIRALALELFSPKARRKAGLLFLATISQFLGRRPSPTRRFERLTRPYGEPTLLKEILFRFLIGGSVVSVFSVLGDVFEPKSFAGLFGAAPSIALATLGLTLVAEGKDYASIEARSMMLGAIAFFLYASAVSWLMMRKKWPAKLAGSVSILLWFAAAFGLWFGLLR